MIHRMRARLSYANVMATIAVFIALGGTGYAAATLPRNSVGAEQIRTGAVRSSEIKDHSIRTGDMAQSARDALRGKTGPQGPAGAAGATGAQGPAGPTYWAAVNSGGGRARGNATTSSHDADTGIYHLRFDRDVSSCGAVAGLASVPGGSVPDPPAGHATTSPESGGIVVRTYDASGTARDLPFNVVIAC